MDSIPQDKPKKVLTEAQRLAFLKGREKRMANLEKKRLADLELASASMSPPPPRQIRLMKYQLQFYRKN
jgi:hypothetical protein